MKRNRLWLLGLGLLTALTLMIADHRAVHLHPQMGLSNLQLNARAAEAPPRVIQLAQRGTQTTPASPTPQSSPASPSPPSSPASPTAPTLSAEELEASPVQLSEERYQDPGGRFTVGVLAEYLPTDNEEETAERGPLQPYKIGSSAGIPLIESPDGNLAYTVIVQPLATARTLSNEELAEIAIEEFKRGEGFSPAEFRPVASGEVLVPWTGIFNNQTPMQGTILVRQRDRSVYLLLISATDVAASKLEPAIALLFETLEPLTPDPSPNP
ncbi:hypothetical protein [Oscillatoria acuminata]|uniref:Uncharacterized protein n=1 Tax=Oscillatoria acuminata PCC 6304 TaxID=56110 RepID=K9TLT6_9CYAN|nr:hypothetical protein [Oscillatoria acuminata]AFY83378.1 hypothetical protein Oscil6304_3823 [Oscillatoria acuminata PCC 6304]